jgi:hypothetical protein
MGNIETDMIGMIYVFDVSISYNSPNFICNAA